MVGGEVSDGDEYDDDDDDDEIGGNGGESEIVDLEDLAGKVPSRRKEAVGAKVNGELNGEVLNGKKEMVTSVIRANSEKQVVNAYFTSMMKFLPQKIKDGNLILDIRQ